MNRAVKVAIVPAMAATLSLTACGSSSKSDAGASTSTAVATSTSTSTGTASAAVSGSSSAAPTTSSQCPTSNTKAFAKTRFVADVGLAAGTFHHFIYKPYQAGSFQKGAAHRTTTIVKGAAVAALDATLVNRAYTEVQASPALCKVLITPLGQLKDAMGGLRNSITSGNLAQIASIDSLVKSVEGTSSSNGAPISENSDMSAAQKAASGK